MLIVLAIVFRISCVNFVDNYEFGYAYNKWNGQMYPLHRQGYIITYPGISVHVIDMRPTQVCINANSRVLNCKLVQFDTCGWRTFVSWHGRNDYDNYSSGSNGGASSGGTLNTILLSYAYDGSGKTYPFLKVLRELKPDDGKKDTVKTKIDTLKR